MYQILIILSSLFSCTKTDNDFKIHDNPSEQNTINLTVDGNARSFVIYLPTGYNNQGKMPMIFINHGGQGNPTSMIQVADFRPLADRDKVILVYPAGYMNTWNEGRPTTANQLGIDDVNFFREMCNYMVVNYAVENRKIYATGISSGGFMASRLGCELSDRIAAIAVDVASFEEGIYNNCNPNNPVPAMYIQGTSDPFVPINGGNIGGGGIAVSHIQAITKWVSKNNCQTTSITTNLPDIAIDGTTIIEKKYTGGTNGSEVVSLVVNNGGHTWPQGWQYLPETTIGKTTQDINGCEVIWAFFKKFARN